MKSLLFITALLSVLILSCNKTDSANANIAGFTPDSTSSETTSKNFEQAFQIGEVVEDFSLKNVDGSMVSMADYTDAKGFIVVFTCNTCPYSQMYEQRIMDMDAMYSSKGWQVIAINPNDPATKAGDSFEKMQELATEKGYKFPYLYDGAQQVYPKWGASRTPHVFIVQKMDNGNVLKYIGAIDDNARDSSAVEKNYVSMAIAALEKGVSPDPEFTRAIGCSIKTK